MLNERKNGKTAYIVGDKLFINGRLWKGQEAAECDENSTENESSGKSGINICTWNISKGLVRKLSDSGFLNIVKEYDVLCFNECWVKCPDDFDIEGYEKKHVHREKLTVVALWYFLENG